MSHLPRIAARIFNTPLLLTPEVAETIAAALEDRLEGGRLLTDDPRVKAFDDDGGNPSNDDAPYIVVNGTAVISIQGELVNRGSWLNSISGLTSYEGLRSALQTAADDASVFAILLDIDSPGGEAAGAMETGAFIRDISAQKPVAAYVDGLGASAAYALAAGANKIFVAPSATVGSIGVVLVHRDRSAAMAKAGVKATLIHAGAHKVDGSAMQPLSDEARARIQGYVNQTYDLFVDHVAQMRGLDPEAIRATEGGLRFGAGAVEEGLADEVSSKDGAIAYLNRGRLRAPQILNGAMMSTEEAAANATALKEAIAAERKRASTILTSAEAKGRESLAQHFAYDTEMSAEAAIAALAKAPQASATRIDPKELAHDVRPENDKVPEPNAAAPWDVIAKAANEEARRYAPSFIDPMAPAK